MNFKKYLLEKSDKKVLFFLKLLIITYVFTDFTRLFFGQSNISYLLIDSILIIFYLTTDNYFSFLNDLKMKIVVFNFLIFIIYITFQFFNFNYYSFIVNLSGFRTYVLPIFILPIGYIFAKKEIFEKSNIQVYIIFISLITIIYAFFQLYTDPMLLSSGLQEFVIPQEHGVHSSDSGDIRLISSFFASSKRFGRFLILMYLLYVSINEQKSIKIKKYIPLLFLIAIFITGAREIFISFIFLNIFIFFKNLNLKNVFILLISCFLLFLITYTLINKSENKDVLISMIDFQKSSYEEKGERFNALFPLFDLKLTNRNLFFGIGPGKFGQEARLDQDIYNKNEFFSSQFYNSDHNYTEGFNTDAGLSKIFIELGITGILILAFCFLPVYIKIFIIIFSKNYNSIKFHLSFYILIWTALFFKSHPVISDVFLSSFLYFSIGFIFYEEESYKS